MIPTFAIILTHNRPKELETCVGLIKPQVDAVIVIDNASEPPVDTDDLPGCYVVAFPLQPPNLSKNMNLGFDIASELAYQHQEEQWNTVMLCDDVEVPEDWVTRVGLTMRTCGAAAASTATIRPILQPVLKTQPDSDIVHRMAGPAFMVAGEKRLRADENMQWWFQDTDLDWQARSMGGMVIAPGPIAINTRPNDFTVNKPELGEQAGRDRVAFNAKWGWVPW